MGMTICIKIAVFILAVCPTLWLMIQAATLRQKILSFLLLLVSMFGINCYATIEQIGTVVFDDFPK